MIKKLLLTVVLCTPILSFAQNDCNNPITITEGLHTVDGINGEKPTLICAENGDNATAGEWYVYTPSEDLNLTITSDLPQNSGGDTRFHVYTGTCGNFSCHAGDDDGGDIGNGYLSYEAFNVYAGTTYYIAWDNNWNSGGFQFELIENDFVQPPPPPPVSFTTQSISTSGSPLAVVDMNGDHLDDVVSVTASNVNINYQESSGGFFARDISTPTAQYTPSWSLAAGDFNADGYNDLLYGNGSGVSFMKTVVDANNLNNGNDYDDVSGFTQHYTNDYVFSQRSNFADIDSDGNLDAFVCHDVAPNVYYINDGSGNLTYYQSDDPSAPVSLGVYPSGGNYGSIWIDYDNDRDLDMFIAKCGGEEARRRNQMHTNDGSGNYTENAAALGLSDPMQTWSSAWGDFDNDGDMDVFVGASSGSHKLMRNDSGVFVDATSGSGISVLTVTSIETVTHDLDNDGNLDVISGGNVLLGNGDLTFTVYEALLPLGGGSYGDVNNDGFIDGFNGTLYLNDTNDNNWIKIHTVGTASNINGIGARVEVHTASGIRIRDVRSGDGFRYMSSLNTHVGIGDDTQITKIVIYWPSGIVDTVNNPTINTPITVVEGASLDVTDEALVDLSIYPNPVKDVLTITTSAQITDYIATVFDINGKRILNSKLTSNQLDVSSLQGGVYFLRLESDGKSIKRKFIKQ